MQTYAAILPDVMSAYYVHVDSVQLDSPSVGETAAVYARDKISILTSDLQHTCMSGHIWYRYHNATIDASVGYTRDYARV